MLQCHISKNYTYKWLQFSDFENKKIASKSKEIVIVETVGSCSTCKC